MSHQTNVNQIAQQHKLLTVLYIVAKLLKLVMKLVKDVQMMFTSMNQLAAKHVLNVNHHSMYKTIR